MLQERQPAPEFALRDAAGNLVRLADLRGKKVVLYFYPKDDTPGCTRQACGFRDDHARFQDENVVVLGVSPDDEASHRAFADKFQLPFTLLADPGGKVAAAYGVWKEKSMAGRTYMGVERTTFLIDEQGIVQRIFPKVNVDGHIAEVLGALAS
jgi:thioredoxin-dependent peroxiredoxin